MMHNLLNMNVTKLNGTMATMATSVSPGNSFG